MMTIVEVSIISYLLIRELISGRCPTRIGVYNEQG